MRRIRRLGGCPIYCAIVFEDGCEIRCTQYSSRWTIVCVKSDGRPNLLSYRKMLVPKPARKCHSIHCALIFVKCFTSKLTAHPYNVNWYVAKCIGYDAQNIFEESLASYSVMCSLMSTQARNPSGLFCVLFMDHDIPPSHLRLQLAWGHQLHLACADIQSFAIG